MKISLKLGLVTLAIIITTLVWYFLVIDVFVAGGPDNKVSGKNITLLVISTLALIAINIAIESATVVIWLKKSIEWYMFAILILISLANLVFIVVKLTTFL